jgi:predicted DNA-binding transcriptional regulator AlpA
MRKQTKPRKRRKPSRLWQRAEYDPRSAMVAPKHLPLSPAGVHYQTAYRMRQRDPHSFPAPVQLSPGRIAWRRVDLERWNEQRTAVQP